MRNKISRCSTYLSELESLYSARDILECVIKHPSGFRVSIRQLETNKQVELYGTEDGIRQFAIKQKEVAEESIDYYLNKMKELWR